MGKAATLICFRKCPCLFNSSSFGCLCFGLSLHDCHCDCLERSVAQSYDFSDSCFFPRRVTEAINRGDANNRYPMDDWPSGNHNCFFSIAIFYI